MLEWIKLLMLDKEIIEFGMDELFYDCGYEACETDRPIVAGRVFVPFLKDWCNICSSPVLGQGTSAHRMVKEVSKWFGYPWGSFLKESPRHIVWSTRLIWVGKL